MKKSTVVFAALISLGMSAHLPRAMAAENGATNWPLGVNTILPALLPPPGGTQFYSYTVRYSANTFVDGKGRSAIPGFRLTQYAQALRFVHTWDYQTEGGVRFSSGAIPSADHTRLRIGGTRDEATGFNQIYLTPLYLTYSPSPALHLLAGFSGFVPLGDVDKNSLANTTNNYRSYVQEFGLTWFMSPAWEISLSPTLSFNERNRTTRYRSGNVLNTDFSIGYRPASMPQLQVSLAGYHTYQFSDDSAEGGPIAGGNRLRKLGLGPQVFYAFDKASGIVVKALREVDVENGPKGNSLWLQFTMPL